MFIIGKSPNSMRLPIRAGCQMLAYEIDMGSQHVQHACVSSGQPQMVRALIELMKFRNDGVGVMSLALSKFKASLSISPVNPHR
jgi:hypothetical protein